MVPRPVEIEGTPLVEAQRLLNSPTPPA